MAGTRRLLTVADRVEISTGLKAGWSAARIARSIGRVTSVVTREIARNSTKTRGYQVVTADVAAQRRRSRPQGRKVASDPVLKTRVLADLKQSRSPRQIAGRLTLEASDDTVELMKGPRPRRRAEPFRMRRSTSSSTRCHAGNWPGTASSCAVTKSSVIAVNLLVSGVLRSLGWPRSVIRPQPTGGCLGTGEGDLVIGRNGASAAVKSLGF